MEKAFDFLSSFASESMGALFGKSKRKQAFCHLSSDPSPSGDNQPNSSIDYSSTSPKTMAHTDSVLCLCNSQWGDRSFYSGSKDKCYAHIEIEGPPRLIFKQTAAHERELTKIAYCPTTQNLFTGSRDKHIKIWYQDRLQTSIEAHSLVITGLASSTDGKKLVSGSRDNVVKLWDISQNRCIKEESIPRNLVTHMHWGSNSNLVAQSSEDKEMRIWDVRSLQVAVSFPRHQYIQTCCQFSPDLNTCLSCSNGFGGNGCDVTIWDIRGRRAQCSLKGHRESVGSCSFVQSTISGRLLVLSGASDSTLSCWDPALNINFPLFTIEFPGAGPLCSLLVLGNEAYCGEKIAVATFNSGIQFVQLSESSRSFSPVGSI